MSWRRVKWSPGWLGGAWCCVPGAGGGLWPSLRTICHWDWIQNPREAWRRSPESRGPWSDRRRALGDPGVCASYGQWGHLATIPRKRSDASSVSLGVSLSILCTDQRNHHLKQEAYLSLCECTNFCFVYRVVVRIQMTFLLLARTFVCCNSLS